MAIDQLCCKPGSGRWPTIRVAEHRCQIGPDFQHKTLEDYKGLWSVIHGDTFHYFPEKSFEESKARCDALDMQYAAFTEAEGESWIKELMR